MQTEAMKRAKRGDKFLSKRKPNYWENVKIEKLDLGNPQMCILGQTYGRFRTGLLELGIDLGGDDDVRLGFEAGKVYTKEYRDEVWVTHEELDAAWIRILAKHKGV